MMNCATRRRIEQEESQSEQHDLSPSGTRIVFKFRIDLVGEVGKKHDATIVRSGEFVGVFRRGDLQCGRVG